PAASSVIIDPPVASSICLALSIIQPLHCNSFLWKQPIIFFPLSAGAFSLVLLVSIKTCKSTSTSKSGPADCPPYRIFEGGPVAETAADALYLLVLFMSFAGYQHNVSRRSQFYCHADSNVPVGYNNVTVSFYPFFNVFDDCLGVLVPGIVRGDNDEIAQPGGDFSHFRTFSLVSVSSAPKDSNDLASFFFLLLSPGQSELSPFFFHEFFSFADKAVCLQ